jgi:O-antigen ligase
MKQSSARTLLIILGGITLFGMVLLLRPSYLAIPEVLGSVIVAEIVLASICKYRQSFFPVLMGAFLWAGISAPLNRVWLQGRWIVLAIGCLAGIAIYMKDRYQRFGVIHLLAFFSALSAVVSASVSNYPQEALLKSLSLFLLFAYAATGARMAVPRLRPELFFRKLLLIGEIATCIICMAYFVLHWAMFGNPNSLGAVAGVVLVPLLLWGILTAEGVAARRRMTIVFCCALLLLISSFSRAGIVAAVFSCLLLLVAVRKYRLIVAGAALFAAIATLVVSFAPKPTENLQDARTASITSLFLYKGKPQSGILGSRRGPWDETVAIVKEHPWFGSGFGTSITGQSEIDFDLTRSQFVDSRTIREHGNSYLAILEWSGLLGVFPFYFLVAVCAAQAIRVLVQLRRTGNVFGPAVPAAAVILAGLMGAAFEDWLFAVGYYLSVFFWVMAFILADLVHSPNMVYSPETPLSSLHPEIVASLAAH